MTDELDRKTMAMSLQVHATLEDRKRGSMTYDEVLRDVLKLAGIPLIKAAA